MKKNCKIKKYLQLNYISAVPSNNSLNRLSYSTYKTLYLREMPFLQQFIFKTIKLYFIFLNNKKKHFDLSRNKAPLHL